MRVMSRQRAIIFNNPLIKQINNKIINHSSINTKMATQVSASKIQNKSQKQQNLLHQKEEFIKQLVERCNRQEKRIAKLLSDQQINQQVKVIQFEQYNRYINESQFKEEKVIFLCLKLQTQSVSKQRPIIISNNLQVQALPIHKLQQRSQNITPKSQVGIFVNTTNQKQFQSGLAKNVADLKQNITKCESLITSLKQFKEAGEIQGKQKSQLRKQAFSDKQRSQRQETQELKTYIENLELELLKCSKTNQKLRLKIQQLEQAQQYYLSVIQQLQINRIKYTRGSPSKQLRQMKKQEKREQKTPNKQKKKTGKVYLVNY